MPDSAGVDSSPCYEESALGDAADAEVLALADMADDPEPQGDQNQLYDGPGPHRVTRTL
jgi:hypothetical protein